MSDDEYYEEEVTSQTSKKGDDAFAKAKVGAKKGELDEQLREYIGEWRKQRAKEEEELKRMKDKQAKRKEIRAEQVMNTLFIFKNKPCSWESTWSVHKLMLSIHCLSDGDKFLAKYLF
jgi:hypothetical protein